MNLAYSAGHLVFLSCSFYPCECIFRSPVKDNFSSDKIEKERRRVDRYFNFEFLAPFE